MNESSNPEMGFEESIDAIANILDPNAGKPDKRAAEVEADGDEDHAEAAEHEADESDDAETEEREAEAADGDNLDEVEIDGKKYRVPPELKAGYLRQQDYTRKTQELADKRRASEAEFQQGQQMRSQYMQGLQILQNALQAAAPPPPDQALLADDPIEYVRQEKLWQAHQQRIVAVANEQNRHAQQLQQEQSAQWQRSLQQAREQLPELIPAWKDAKRAEAEKAEVAKYLATQGFTAEEIQTAADPRAVVISRKAWLYDQMMAAKQQAKPVAPKVAPAGPARQPSSTTAAEQKARQALRRSGGRDKAAAEFLISKFL